MNICNEGPYKRQLSRRRRKLRNLRQSAKVRRLGISLQLNDFGILLQEFPVCPSCACKFTAIPGDPVSLTFDRIDPNEGYHLHNVQLLCQSCNVRKRRTIQRFRPKSEWHPAAADLWYPELTLDIASF